MSADQKITRQSQVDRVVEAITKLCTTQKQHHIGTPETWPSTRDIAEDCKFSIYKTRYLLLKMEKKGWVQMAPHPIKNTLRWWCTYPNMLGKEQPIDNELMP
ncbi:FaeA/PapI family transcriptional regulator [Serratia quinivorans]|uniref:FaeA/PapI family transcriptional regulator n=1 Tax=Serratia quinivorans TaxID=137545 RepID=UPI0021BD9FCB|nr:FaeA/PapI family transcriptional regulator [Serratia quinivorans]